MLTLEPTILNRFEEDGYVVAEGLLDPVDDLQPVVDEYSELLDRLATEWWREGRIPSAYSGLSFSDRLTRIAVDTGGNHSQHLEISLPQKNIRPDTPMHHGPATFDLLRNAKLLDGVETFIGPEIYSNPVQHLRVKPPERYIPEAKLTDANLASTYWHQDQGVITEDADDSNVLTVFIAVTEATVDNGCLAVVPGSHKGGLGPHCLAPSYKGIPDEHVGENRVPVPMKPGDVLFMTRLTKHSSLPNVSDEIRWSFDIRYSPIGEPTGRPWFPGFVARSRANPESELTDPEVWAQKWREARSALAKGEMPNFNRWDPNDPMCA